MSSLSDAIAALEAQRAKLDVAIEALRALDDNSPSPAPARKPRATSGTVGPRRSPKAATPATSDQEAAARKALARGPLTPKAFTEATGLGRHVATQLIDAGIIVASGATLNRRYALPGKPAKEAP